MRIKIYGSTFISFSILFILFTFHLYLIIYGKSTVDINNFVNMVSTKNVVTNNIEYLFRYILDFLSLFFSNEKVIQIIRLVLLISFCYLGLKLNRNLSFLMLINPIVIIGMHNSIRQSLAILLISFAFTLIKNNKFKILIFLSGILTHISAIAGIILIKVYDFFCIGKARYSLSFVFLAFISVSIFFYFFSYEIFSFFGKEDYLRNEEFIGRKSSFVKAIYLLLIGLIPIFTGNLKYHNTLHFLIFLSLSFFVYLNIFSDAIFRITYYIQFFLFLLLLKEKSIYPKHVKFFLLFLLLFVNTSGYTMISNLI